MEDMLLTLSDNQKIAGNGASEFYLDEQTEVNPLAVFIARTTVTEAFEGTNTVGVEIQAGDDESFTNVHTLGKGTITNPKMGEYLDIPIFFDKSFHFTRAWYTAQGDTTPAWKANTAYAVNDKVLAGGNIYKCTTAGTSVLSPTGTGTFNDGTLWQAGKAYAVGNIIRANSGIWKCTKAGTLINAPTGTAAFTDGTPWAANRAYTAGAKVRSGDGIYTCKTAGTSGTTAPAGTTGDITDGTAVWNYSGTALRWNYAGAAIVWAYQVPLINVNGSLRTVIAPSFQTNK